MHPSLNAEIDRCHSNTMNRLEKLKAMPSLKDVQLTRLRSALAASQLEAGTQIYRQQRALASILRHAAGPDLSPPLRLSIQETRRIAGEVDHA